MASGIQRKRRPGQKGVQAIFTSDRNSLRVTQVIAGMLVTGVGASIWGWNILVLLRSTASVVQSDWLFSSLILISVAMMFVMGGVGVLVYSLAVRRAKQESQKIESVIYELDASSEMSEGFLDPRVTAQPSKKLSDESVSSHRAPKTLVVALLEGVMLIIFYGSLVQEYKSNANMQQWLRANILFGGYLLNDNALFLFVGALVAFIAFQFRPARHQRKEFASQN